MVPFPGIQGSQQQYLTQQTPQTPHSNQQFVPKKVIENYSYQLTDQIGKGYSSKVFRGKDERTDEEVAVKVIDMKLMSNEVQLFLLQNEISVMKRLSTTNNLNLLKLADYYQTANNTYIITDICNQGDLKELLAKYTSLEESQALKILKHLLNGYKELAKNRIVHRDIKPANILLNNGIPKLADFGFAKDIDSPPYKYYYNVGTPMYMCPQISNESKDFIIGCLQVDERRRFSFEQLETHSIHKLNFKKDKQQQQQQQQQQQSNNPISAPSQGQPSVPAVPQHQKHENKQQNQYQALKRGGSLQTPGSTQTNIPTAALPMIPSSKPENGKENSPPARDNLVGFPQPKTSKLDNESNQPVSESLGFQPAHQSLHQLVKQVSLPAPSLREDRKQQILEQPQDFQVPANFTSVNPPVIIHRNTEEEDDKTPTAAAGITANLTIDKLSGSQKDNNTVKYNNNQAGNTPILSTSTNNNNNNIYVPFNPTIEGKSRNRSPGNNDQESQPQYPQQQPIQQSNPTPTSCPPNVPAVSTGYLSRNDQIILAQINMCRFLFRLAKLTEDSTILETPLLKEKLIFLIMKSIFLKISHLKTMSDQQTNSLSLADWSDYIKSDSFHRFQLVIGEYYVKYSNAFNEKLSTYIQQHSLQFHRDKKFQAIFDDNPLEFESFYLIMQSFLRHSIREINHLTKIKLNGNGDTSLQADNERNIVLLDYLVTVFQLTNLLLEEFNDYGFFADNSRIEQIAEGKPVRLTKTHYAQIRQKIQSLEI